MQPVKVELAQRREELEIIDYWGGQQELRQTVIPAKTRSLLGNREP